MVVIIFLCSILLIIIVGVIEHYFIFIKPYKKAVANLKVGDKYTYTIEDDDPFIVPEILECTIKEIRYDRNKNPYVKYEFKDGSADSMRFDKFFVEFDKVN